MKAEGNIIKMKTKLDDSAHYYLPIGGKTIFVNELIGTSLKISFAGQINCIKCGKRIRKTYNQGFCYNCFLTAPEADPSIINPELDKSHLGISRDMEWAKQYSLQPHFVYLSVSSHLKVGVTKATNLISRWIDQGAVKGIVIAETPNRHLAGLIEVELKKHFADKTNWRKMLTGNIDLGQNLIEEKLNASELLSEELKKYVNETNKITEIKYDVISYPEKVKSIDFLKTPEYTGKLVGIKAQYLIFDDQKVLNIRKHNGFYLKLEF
ncbi:MAG: DUF2797 domain-containing protein [Bacteroidota bacterium]|nr:DUF2797 domain-containing protein [Bacteroidota bacterium]